MLSIKISMDVMQHRVDMAVGIVTFFGLQYRDKFMDSWDAVNHLSADIISRLYMFASMLFTRY